MKLDNRKKRETEDHEATVRELERELAKDKGEFMQDAIKQGISRSSIVKSVGQQLEEEKRAEAGGKPAQAGQHAFGAGRDARYAA